MLNRIKVVSDTPFYIPVDGAKTRDSLRLESITGLGPPDKNLFLGDYARDGGVYTGRRVLTRNPVMNIDINPNYRLGETMDGWRDLLYKAFHNPTPGYNGLMIVLEDDVKEDRYFIGNCEKFGNEIFGDDNVVQISMICPDPYIRNVDSVEMVGSWTEVPFVYTGTADTGFEATIEVVSPSLTVTLANNDEKMILVYGAGFEEGDIIKIDTNPGKRSITMTRGSTIYNILYTLSSDSPWLFLRSISNSLKVYGETEVEPVAAVTNFKFTPSWWGL